MPRSLFSSVTGTKTSGELLVISYLRGLAALGVVLYHVRGDLWVGWKNLRLYEDASSLDYLASWLAVPWAFTGSGVLLFFVISGFCIHYPFSGSAGRVVNWRTYAIRRFLRIYPPYLAALVLASMVEYVGLLTGQLSEFRWSINVGAIFFLQDFTGGQPVCNGPLWTIPVEVGFYLLFPIVYRAFKTNSKTLPALTLLAAIAALLLDFVGIHNVIVQVFGYWIIWVMGANLAKRYRAGTLSPPGIGLFVGAFAALLSAIGLTAAFAANPGGMRCSMLANYGYGFFFVVVVQWLLLHQDLLQLLPTWIARACGIIGTISFSLYLVHTPFFILTGWLWETWDGHKPINFLVSLGFCFLVMLIACLFYRAVELPFHNLARKLAH